MLFKRGTFILHSGELSRFKIDCDGLSDYDIATLAEMIASKVSFTHVVGVPRGGLRLAAALQEYREPEYTSELLIVDDVLTTGKSMEEYKESMLKHCVPHVLRGVVIFDRSNGKCPDWVTPLFKVNI